MPYKNELKKLLVDNFPKAIITNARLLEGMEEHYFLDNEVSIIKWDKDHYLGSYEYSKKPFNFAFPVRYKHTLVRRISSITGYKEIINIKKIEEIEECPYCGESQCAERFYLTNGKSIVIADCEPDSYNKAEKILGNLFY